MEARYAFRTTPVLEEWQVAPEIFEQVIPRLYSCMQPVVTLCPGQAAAQHATTAVCGLWSDIERKHVASMASRFGPSRLPLHGFMGWDEWDDAPVREALRSQVKTHVGQGDGVWVCDPAGCPKSGRESVGVARQWCGRLGTVDHCPVALSLGYVSRQGHTRGDTRRYLPQAGPQEKARLDQAGVPTADRAYRTRHQWALERRETNGAALPPRWIAGDDERGRPSWWRRRLDALRARDMLAVPAHTARRDVAVAPPAESGRGRHPTRPGQPVEAWSPSLDDAAWHRLAGRDGSKGPLVLEAVQRRVVSRTPRRPQGAQETLVVLRSRARDQEQVVQGESALSNTAPETPLGACARVATAAHRMAACLQRSKRAAGVADAEGRHGTGWPPPHTLAFLATWCLGRETQRGKKMDPGDHRTPDAPRHRDALARGLSVWNDVADAEGTSEALATPCACALLPLATASPTRPIELTYTTVLVS